MTSPESTFFGESEMIKQTFYAKVEANSVIVHEDKTGLNKYKLEFTQNLYKALNETVIDIVTSSQNQKQNHQNGASENPKNQIHPLYVQSLKNANWSYQIK